MSPKKTAEEEAYTEKRLQELRAETGDEIVNPNTAVMTVTEKPQARSLAWKISEIYGEVKRLKKSGYNKYQDYHYPVVGDVYDMLREQLHLHHIAFFPSMESYDKYDTTTRKGEPAVRMVAKFEVRFVDGDTGEREVVSWFGEALETSDKTLNKCSTAAAKFLLLTSFLISSGEDPDNEGIEVGERPAPAPKKPSGANQDMAMVLQSAARAKGMDWDKLAAFMQENGSDPFSMNPEEAKKWLQWVESRQPKKTDAAKTE